MRILDIATGDQVMQFNHDSPDGTMTSQVCITYTGDIVTCRDCRACLWQLRCVTMNCQFRRINI